MVDVKFLWNIKSLRILYFNFNCECLILFILIKLYIIWEFLYFIDLSVFEVI